MARRPSESLTMLSDQGKQSFDPAATFRQPDFSPTMLQQQQQQQQQNHFASGHQQQHVQNQQHKQQPQQQHFHRGGARPASEILPQGHHHPFHTNNFQSPEAEAIDKWFEDLSHYEQTLEEMAVVSLDMVFKDELSTIESWFRVLSEAERTAALYSLLQHSSQVQIRFFITVLQQMAKKDPVGALLSPTHNEKDPVQNQLHGAMLKAEMEASQRLLNVLPIQPPAPLDRPAAQRRLYDRHSVTIGGSEEYNRLFRRDGHRNSIDFLGRTTPIANNNNSNNGNNKFGSSGSLNGSTNSNSSGVIGSGVLSESVAARSNQFKTSPGSLNRISAPNMFGNRPKSVHEGDTSSVFSSNWNFASLGANPLPNMNGGANGGISGSAGSTSGSPGNIGDRTSFGRPKSVGGAEWMLSSANHSGLRSGSASSQGAAADGLDKPWTPLIMSPTMGGFHNGSNGTGHSLSAGSFAGSSGLAVERPKSVTEADLAKLNISQWVQNNNAAGGGNAGSSQRTGASLEEIKANNRRRTLLRPSAIISNVPVTVLEGDEKLLSASANTSSINIVSTMFNETTSTDTTTGAKGDGSGSVSSSSAEAGSTGATGATAATAGGNNAQDGYNQQQQQAVQLLQTLTLDPSASNSHRPSSGQQNSQSLQQPRSRATSPFSSPLPSPIKASFRSRPVSGSTSPRLMAQQQQQQQQQHQQYNNNGNNNNAGSSTATNAWTPAASQFNHGSHAFGSDQGLIPVEYNQKRHLSPPGGNHSRPLQQQQGSLQPQQQQMQMHHNSNLYNSHYHHMGSSSSTTALDDDYLSDTSDISSLGMNGHHGRGGSAPKDKKQPEGVDFELLQDTPAWLRSLRLHKYNNIFEGMNWRDIVNLSDGDLINKGVAALGARRKMLKVFEQVRKEMLLQGMII